MNMDEYLDRTRQREWDRSGKQPEWERTQERVRIQEEMSKTKVNRSDPFSTKTGKGPGKVSMTGFGVGAVIDTALNMKAGDDFGTAAVKGAFTGMLWTTAPWVMGAMELGKAVPSMYEGYFNWKKQKEQWWNTQFRPNFGGNYQDTRRALTMRQAAVEAIQGSKLNARSALGGEARILSDSFHRG